MPSGPVAGKTVGLLRRNPGCGNARAGERTSPTRPQQAARSATLGAPAAPAGASQATPPAVPAQGGWCGVGGHHGPPAAAVPSTAVAGIGKPGTAAVPGRFCRAGPGVWRAARVTTSRVALAAPAPQVRRVLDTAGLTKILPVYDAEADAVHAARQPPAG